MTHARSLPFALALAIAASAAIAAQDDQHQAHHPAGAASAPASKARPGKAKPDMAGMDAQMKAMKDGHDKMMAAKTPEERNALMAEHMKTMQDGMSMMNGMPGGDMGGMKGEAASRQQMMDKRMDMMQSMMQMRRRREAVPRPWTCHCAGAAGMRSIIICIMDCIISMRLSIICWREAASPFMLPMSPPDMPFIMLMPSCMVVMCSTISALRSSGVLAAIILSCMSFMAFIWASMRALSDLALAGIAVEVWGGAEAAPAGWCA